MECGRPRQSGHVDLRSTGHYQALASNRPFCSRHQRARRPTVVPPVAHVPTMLAVGVPPLAWRCRTVLPTRHVTHRGTGPRRFPDTAPVPPASMWHLQVALSSGGRLPASALQLPMELLTQVAFAPAFPVSAAVVARQRKGQSLRRSPCCVPFGPGGDPGRYREWSSGAGGLCLIPTPDPGPAWATHTINPRRNRLVPVLAPGLPACVSTGVAGAFLITPMATGTHSCFVPTSR